MYKQDLQDLDSENRWSMEFQNFNSFRRYIHALCWMWVQTRFISIITDEIYTLHYCDTIQILFSLCSPSFSWARGKGKKAPFRAHLFYLYFDLGIPSFFWWNVLDIPGLIDAWVFWEDFSSLFLLCLLRGVGRRNVGRRGQECVVLASSVRSPSVSARTRLCLRPGLASGSENSLSGSWFLNQSVIMHMLISFRYIWR